MRFCEPMLACSHTPTGINTATFQDDYQASQPCYSPTSRGNLKSEYEVLSYWAKVRCHLTGGGLETKAVAPGGGSPLVIERAMEYTCRAVLGP